MSANGLVPQPERTLSQIGQQPRVAPGPGIEPIAGPMLGTNPHVADVSPHSDPFGSGLLGNSSSALLNRSAPGHGSGVGGSTGGGESSPLDLGAVSDVVSDAQAGASGDPLEAADNFARDQIAKHGDSALYPSDADPQHHGVFAVNGRMTHIRPMTGPTGGSTGTFAASDLGDA